MIRTDDSVIPERFDNLWKMIKAHGAEQWLEDKGVGPDLEGLTYLCRFAFFTGLISKGEVARQLELTGPERKKLIKTWYDIHREKGCGAC
ncbi:hypothetical protein [Dethiosulfatarculus sandiegensis]|uniref:Uncharacterized protein n=1 Tax=Dethiosulfatarculus sandiegensis TaxID=1429043 RepID=A0A0D2J657_9BACT|nr:hypothetical protein [Dethiosulfatarculus sandiegensis]KIX11196.1 hypothetical protein X474_25235 [Dethiosulfatarculus sandiegensis]